MTDSGSNHVRGEVTRGHRVASGLGGDARFPAGTIAPQLPFLRAAIADFDAYLGAPPFAGTINLALRGLRVSPGVSDFTVGPVCWTDMFPPERFLISRCAIEQGDARYPAYLYIPDPLTKPDHHQPGNIVELLAPALPGLHYGDALGLIYRPETLSVISA